MIGDLCPRTKTTPQRLIVHLPNEGGHDEDEDEEEQQQQQRLGPNPHVSPPLHGEMECATHFHPAGHI